MKLRWKIVITIGLAFLTVWLQNRFDKQTAHAVSGRCEGLPVWYADFNEEYFQNKLPKDTEVDYGEYRTEFMATTSRMKDGRFHIAFNEDQTKAPRIAHLFLLHEMCHVKTFFEDDPETRDTPGGSHGPLWRSCMLTLEMEGANRAILIDAYKGQ